MLFVGISVFAQQTSMTVDNQTPGWLSSKINFGDQVTLENLVVTGWINGSDIKFIRELNLNRNLHGVIDLENANIVSGGEAYYYKKYLGDVTTLFTKDNTVSKYMFTLLNRIEKLVLPKSITYFEDECLFAGTEIDTLVVPSQAEVVKGFHGGSINPGYSQYYGVTIGCLILPESVRTVDLYSFFHPDSYSDNIRRKELIVPSTMERIKIDSKVGSNKQTIIRSRVSNPNILTGILYYVSDKTDTIYVPKGTSDAYKTTSFKSWTIIEEVYAEGIDIAQKDASVYVGENFTLSANILPENAMNKKVRWESADETIATVDDNGIVTAVALGKTTIYAISDENSEIRSACEITVYDHTEGVEMACTEQAIHIEEEITLSANTLPLGTSDGKVTWSCSDTDIATVDENGNVKGLKQGKCTITATSVDGGYTASCEVTVMQLVAEVWLDKHELNMNVGDNSALRVNVSPSMADDKTIAWSTEDEDVANVDSDGKVTAVAAGTTKIWATSNDNNEAKDYCEVTVNQPVTGLALDYTEYTLNDIGSTFTLTVEVQPETATNKEVTWRSSDEKVCIVSNGLVVATGYGKAVVMATTKDGGYLAMCTVEVVNATGINDYSSDTLYTIYNENGIKQSSLSKGVNIIRFGNGTTHKVFVK